MVLDFRFDHGEALIRSKTGDGRKGETALDRKKSTGWSIDDHSPVPQKVERVSP